MNRQKWVVLLVGLGLIGGAAGLLAWSNAHQRLGAPGIKTAPIPGSVRLDIRVPELVLDYKSRLVPTETNVLLYMPQDSSFSQHLYSAPDGFQLSLNVVLMGRDRTSIHRPEFCLVGHGLTIDDSRPTAATVPMRRPQPYNLPVTKLTTTRQFAYEGREFTRRGVYVYWFVADNRVTASHASRMMGMAKELLQTGVLQRWAYITCFAECDPGQEDATFARIQKFIQAAVPEFQLTPRSSGASANLGEAVFLRSPAI